MDDNVRGLARELIKFGQLKMTNILLNFDEEPSADFSYDVVSFSENKNITSLNNYQRRSSGRLSFVLTQDQVSTVETSLNVYGDTMTGRARILSFVYIARLLRTPVSAPVKMATALVN